MNENTDLMDTKYLTNKFRNLPFFTPLNLYLNEDSREIRRTIVKENNNLFIDEDISNRIYSSTAKQRHEYELDKNVGTFIFFILRPLLISILTFILFSNLLIQFVEVIKINKSITLITFIASIFLLGFSLIMLFHLFLIAYKGSAPNIKLINIFSKIQYFGYALMLILFIHFNFISEYKTIYLYSCLVHLGMFSFYTYVIYIYILLPLTMVVRKELRFYKNKKDNKLIIVEIKEKL